MSQIILQNNQIKSLPQFQQFCIQLAAHLPAGAIVLLKGVMGAGKTELVKTLARQWGCLQVASPTFAFHHHYQGKVSFHHWDLYRVADVDELESTGFWDELQSSELFFIEWPEKINPSWLPLSRSLYAIEIQLLPEGQRSVVFSQLR